MDPVPAYSRVERFSLSAHADRGGLLLLGMIARYQSGKVILTHGEVAPRANLAGYLSTRQDVSLPGAGEVVTLKDSGRRRGAFINLAPKKLEALKERHARARVEVRHDGERHALVVELPQKLEGEGPLKVLRRHVLLTGGTPLPRNRIPAPQSPSIPTGH